MLIKIKSSKFPKGRIINKIEHLIKNNNLVEIIYLNKYLKLINKKLCYLLFIDY